MPARSGAQSAEGHSLKDSDASAKVRLRDIADALDMNSDEMTDFLDRVTGEIHLVTGEVWSVAENDGSPGELLDWQQEEFETARAIVADEDDRYLAIPDLSSDDQWEVMRDFALSVDEPAQSRLLDGIQGRGAFRWFKREVDRLDLRDAWFSFRDVALLKAAREWCEENGVAFTE